MNSFLSQFYRNMFAEIPIVALASLFPFLYMFLQNGAVSELEGNLKSFVTSGFLFDYTLWMVGIYLFVSLVHYFYRRKSLAFIHTVFAQVASGFINVYRLAAGAFLAFPIIWCSAEPDTLTAVHLIFFLGYGGAFVVVSSFALTGHMWIDEKLSKHLTIRSSRRPLLRSGRS